MSGKSNKDGNSKRQNKLEERVDESSSEDEGEETSELQVSNIDESQQTNPSITRTASKSISDGTDFSAHLKQPSKSTGAIPKMGKGSVTRSRKDNSKELSKIQSTDTSGCLEQSKSSTRAIPKEKKGSVTRSRQSTLKDIPKIKVQDTDTSTGLEQPSASSTGAIPKKGKIGRKTSALVQKKKNYEKESDGTSLLHPEDSRSKRSPKNFVKNLSPVKRIKKLFSKKSSEELKSGPTTRSQTKKHDVSESSESEKDDVGELTDLTKAKKTGKGLFGGLSAGFSSKKPSKSKDRLIGSEDAVNIGDLLEPVSASVDDSSQGYTPPLTEEIDVTSLSTDDVVAPLSRLSTDSPVRKELNHPDQIPETEKDEESESET